MATRTDRGQSWFRLPYNWDMDDGLIGVPEGTKLLFLKIIEFCHSTGSGGTLTAAQLQILASRHKRGKESIDRLQASGALRYGCSKESCGSTEAELRQCQGRAEAELRQSWGSAEAELKQCWSIAKAALWLPQGNQPKSIPPVQNRNRPAKSAENVPRGGAREKREREIEREEERTPSGSVRSSSAQAAPRVAGGATQPALQDQESAGVDGGGTLSRDEAVALARSEIARGRAKNPAATGIDTKFSKYDPDRPIIPITSAFGMNGDSE